MKKHFSIFLASLFILSTCQFVSAQTVESTDWGFRFTLSDNWQCSQSGESEIRYEHTLNNEEDLSIKRWKNFKGHSTRDIQETSIDTYINQIYDNGYLSKDLSAKNTGAKITVSETYADRRYEVHGENEYYRTEKMYLATAPEYLDVHFYTTHFFIVNGDFLYGFNYSCRGDSAPNFPDVIRMLDSLRFPDENGSLYRIGDPIGYALRTDIKATINGHHIPSFNVDGYTYIVAEDLRYYGFAVNYDDATRSLSISRDPAQTGVSKVYTKPYVAPEEVGQQEHILLYTDIKTYLDGYYTPSCNIDGQTIIRFDSLKAYGGVSYDNDLREISLGLEGIL